MSSNSGSPHRFFLDKKPARATRPANARPGPREEITGVAGLMFQHPVAAAKPYRDTSSQEGEFRPQTGGNDRESTGMERNGWRSARPKAHVGQVLQGGSGLALSHADPDLHDHAVQARGGTLKTCADTLPKGRPSGWSMQTRACGSICQRSTTLRWRQ